MKKILLSTLLVVLAQIGFGQITGPTEVCPGAVTSYEFQGVSPCDSAYNWTMSPPLGDFVSIENEPSTEIVWFSTGVTTLCVNVADSCANTVTPFCLPIVVETLPPTMLEFDICVGDCVEVAGQTFCAPGVNQVVLTSSLGCDSVINVILNPVAPSFTDLGEIPIPCVGSFVVCGQTFTQTGVPQTAVCTSSLGCDSIVNFTLLPNDVTADAGDDQLLNCINVFATLDGSASSQGPEYTYTWTGPNGFTSNVLNPTVNETGTYCLTVLNTVTGCEATDCVNVGVDNTVPTIVIAPTVLGCGGTGTTINATVTNVTSPIFEWQTFGGNIVSGGNTIAPFVDEPGLYCLTLMDAATGCVTEECVSVGDGPFVEVDGPTDVCLGDEAIYVATLFSSNNATSFFFSENGGMPTEIPVSSNAATYLINEVNGPITLAVWAVDSEPCETDTAYLEVNLSEYEIDFEVTSSDCNPTQVEALVEGYPSAAFTYNWSNGDTQNPTNVTSNGWYFLTLTDFNGCPFEDSLFVTVDYTGSCAFIEGNVWDDLNVDCAFDLGDVPLEGWLVEASGGGASFYATTDVAGFYSIPVDPGDYTVTIYQTTNLWVPCDNDLPVSLVNVDDVAVVDFFIEKLPGCPQMTVDISSSNLRRCFSNNYYLLDYCNDGVEDALDAYIDLQLDEFLEVVNVGVPYQDLGGDLYRLEIGDVPVGECGSTYVQVTVSCDAILGQTHCAEAHIYPDTLCGGTHPNWSGASLQSEVECSADSVYFTITNVGTAAMSEALEFVVIEDAVMYMEVADGPPLGVGESYTFAVPANGSTWRLEVNQEPFHPSQSERFFNFSEACGVNASGGVSTGFVNMFSQFDNDPFVDIDCRDNIGSYDPNDKQGFPIGYGDEHLILPGTDIEYLIRFQNTGTDTAFTVVIRDTLSSMLDVTTVRPGASSHPYEFEIYGEGILKFTFPDIMLPDSNVNEPLSHGFVEFKVSHQAGLHLGMVIENSAAIYFDFNEPVITNTTDHKLAVAFPMVNQVNVVLDGAELEVFPNPFDESFRLNLMGITSGKKLNFSLLDAFGRVVRVEKFAAPGFVFDAENLSSGLYFFKVEMDGATVATGKILKN